MRTTKKEFVAQVRDYIHEVLNEDYSLQDTNTAFLQWKAHNKKGTFQDFLECIPSEMYVTPFYAEQEDIMASWFENCGVEYDRKRFKPQTFYWLVTREFNNLLKGAN